MSVLCDFTLQQLVDEGRLALQDVVELQGWVRENRDEVPQLTEEQIALFLLAWSNDVEKTKNAIRINYRIRRENPEIFTNRDMHCKEVQKAAAVIELTEFPETTPDGYTVYFGKVSDPVYSNVDMESCIKLVAMSIDYSLHKYPPKGVIVLLDMKGLGLLHLTRIKISLLKPIFQYIQSALNFKLIRVHIINTVYFLDKLMAILSPFLSAELIDLLHFHPPTMDMEEFYKTCIPKKCLPEDYGGELPSTKFFHNKNIKQLTENQYYFDEEENQRLNSSQL